MQNTNGEGGESNLGDLLQEAYENGQLKGRQIIEANRLIEKSQELGPSSPNAAQIKQPTSSYSLVRTYQKEVERQRKMVLKAEHAYQRLLLVRGLKNSLPTKTLSPCCAPRGWTPCPSTWPNASTCSKASAPKP